MKVEFDSRQLVSGMIAMIISAALATALGAQWFLMHPIVLPSFFDHQLVFELTYTLGLWLNIALMVVISTGNVDAKFIGYIGLCYPIVYLISGLELFFAGEVLCVLLCIFGRKNNSIKSVLANLFVAYVLMYAYQGFLLFARTALFRIYVALPLDQHMPAMYDLLPFLVGLAIYKCKGGETYGMAHGMVQQDTHRKSWNVWTSRRRAESVPLSEEQTYWQGLTRGEKTVVVAAQAIQYAVVSAAVALNGKFLVFWVAYLFGFLPQRHAQSARYHAASYLACTLQSTIFFYVICSAIPGMQYSMTCSVIGGALASYGMSMYMSKTTKPKSTARAPRVRKLTKEERIELRDKIDLSSELQELAVYDLLGKNLSLIQISDRLHISTATVSRRIRDIQEKIDAYYTT